MRTKFFTLSWVLGSVLLFLYSYTQVDLSLTLSRASFLQTIQKSFQYVGWFNRSLSTFLYIILFLFLFLIYFWTLRLVQKNKIGHKQLWTVILIVTGIVVLSYNAFSYDLFNYIFDAKIVTFYNQNHYIRGNDDQRLLPEPRTANEVEEGNCLNLKFIWAHIACFPLVHNQ
jgi:hypothetical protein